MRATSNAYRVLHPFTFMGDMQELTVEAVQEQYVCLKGGKGSWVFDNQGNSYLYLTTAVPTLGLGHERVVEQISEQYKTLSFASTCAQSHELVQPLAERLLSLADGPYSSVFFANDGSGAVESAMKLARQYWMKKGQMNRTKFVSLSGNYHGTTFGSGSVTHMGIQEQFGPALEGCLSAPAPHLYHPPIEGGEEAVVDYCLEQLEALIEQEGAETIAAVLIEPIQGVNGVVLFPDRYWHGFQQLVRQYDILMIADEVGTGIGRTGHWFASHRYQLEPDLLIVSKGLTGGYFPMGATLISHHMMETLYAGGGIFLHGSTMCGHPVGCAAALAVLDVIEEQQLVEHAARVGNRMLEQLRDALDDHPQVGEVRGMGMMLAIEFVDDQATRQPVNPQWGQALTQHLRSEGILGNFFNSTLAMYPPLTLSQKEAEFVVNGVVQAVRRTGE
ncbi:aspartate aminotransferase family protein [Brevibacillus humidisoli]|uniref:aminotransferase family protein n=1 Tax=Brevibacillus humidisoli TaxID=2895522 RepID=UPI001E463526|nr:aspartate aminotransferase family protein [Brevibacillus humidisoli]UFJ42405.1 aspartate aminotransferase family protein [Brevibacillus humidisoli]